MTDDNEMQESVAERPTAVRRTARTARRPRPETETAAPENRLRRTSRTSTARSARAPAREDTSREEERAPAEGRLYRQRKKSVDKYYVDKRIIPAGTSYEWKRESTFGATDPDHQMEMRDNHWKPVPSSRHPQLVAEGYNGPIKKDGMILMERPSYLTQEAAQEAYDEAKSQVTGQRNEIRSGPDGTFERRQASIKTSYEPMMIPD